MLCILFIAAAIIQILCLVLNVNDERYDKAAWNALFAVGFLMLAGDFV